MSYPLKLTEKTWNLKIDNPLSSNLVFTLEDEVNKISPNLSFVDLTHLVLTFDLNMLYVAIGESDIASYLNTYSPLIWKMWYINKAQF